MQTTFSCPPKPRLSAPLVRRRRRAIAIASAIFIVLRAAAINDSPQIQLKGVLVECSDLAPYCSGYDFVRQKCGETCGCTPIPLPPTPTPSGASYCPDPSNVFFAEYGTVQGSSNGWTIYGNARVSSKASLNLVGEFLDFDVEFSVAHEGMKSNLEIRVLTRIVFLVILVPLVVPRWTSQKTTVTVFRQPRSSQHFVVSPATFPSSHRYGMGLVGGEAACCPLLSWT